MRTSIRLLQDYQLGDEPYPDGKFLEVDERTARELIKEEIAVEQTPDEAADEEQKQIARDRLDKGKVAPTR